MRCLRECVSGLASLLCAATVLAQQPAHVIRGRVTTDSGSIVRDADVIVTVAPTAETVSGKADAAGMFRVVIARPTGEYILYVASLGRRPFRQRVTIASPETTAIVNVRLLAAVATVAAVRVQAQRARPVATLANDGRAGTDATDRTFDGVTGALSPDLQGSIDAMAATIPGLSTIGGGVSAFGLGPDANATTLNGLAFAGTDLPRDARTATRFRTSPWDPTIGGFSGVQASVSLIPGNNVTTRRGHATLDAPMLQVADPVAARLGQRYTAVAVDEGGVGAYALDKLYYNFGIHLARQSAAVASLTDLDADALRRAGISPDSAARVLQAASALGIPVTAGASSARSTSTVSFMERIDRAAPVAADGIPAPTLALTGFGKYSRTDAIGLTPTTTSAYAGRSANGIAGAQMLYARYFGATGDYINETTSGISYASSTSRPYAELPAGSVLVASGDGIGTLLFGGNSALASSTAGWTWETINQTGFLAGGHPSLPMKLYLQSRFDTYDQSLPANRLGRFTYASPGDVAADQPSSYSRTLNAPDRSGGEWVGAAALGGNYTRGALSLVGGARMDVNAFLARPAYNPGVEQAFGLRTDDVPDGLSLSPRLGFVWRYTPTIGYTSLSASGASVNRGSAQLRGGIGKFRGVLSPTSVADALSFTGLPGSAQQLLCIGAAIPAPTWTSFSADVAPTSCRSGASSLADTARAITTFARSFAPSESWRANLGWTSSQLLYSYVAVDATYSRTSHVGSTIDLNFDGASRFTLADEGNRPVFVSTTSIVPATGAVSPLDARQSASFGRVADRMSDLHADARQLSATVMPNIPLPLGVLIFSYTYVDSRGEARGFDGATGGDPRIIESAPSSFMPRHTVSAQWAHFFATPHLTVSAMFRAASGLPFTPMVQGDINGDGAANDRAFVYDPSTVQDAQLASGLRALVSTGPGTARKCLEAQVGHVAARNSCTGPWGSTMNTSLIISDLPKTDGRTRILINLANMTSGLDQLLHGNDKLHGWGLTPLPDPTLYVVRGFDPTTRRFLYDVNPRFGSSSPSTTTRRSPFRVTLDVEVGLGTTPDQQRVEQNIRVRPSLTGTRASADTIKARYLRTAGTDIYAQMLRMSDSLALSRVQTERFQARQKVLRQRADSIYTELATYLARLPDRFDAKEAARVVSDTRDSLWQTIRAERPFVLETLTPGQVRLLPALGLRDMIMNPSNRSMFFAGGWTP